MRVVVELAAEDLKNWGRHSLVARVLGALDDCKDFAALSAVVIRWRASEPYEGCPVMRAAPFFLLEDVLFLQSRGVAITMEEQTGEAN